MDIITLKIKRQDDPNDLPYWEEFEVDYKPGQTVISLLEAIGERPATIEGNPTAPVAHESSCMEGMCGTCSMTINGRAMLACKAFVDEIEQPILLEPLAKFPIVRDLVVDKSRMFDALARTTPWTGIDGVHEHGPAIRIHPEDQQRHRIFSECIMCGACSVACPQVNERSGFAGAFMFSHIVPLNSHPIGAFDAGMRLDSLLERGGIADCSGAKSCQAVCPKGIPLSEAISKLGWATSVHSVKRLFWG